MSYFTLGYRLPHLFSAPLFGDRKKHGLIPNVDDPCWREWQKTYVDFYLANQKQSVGGVVNHAGYRVMKKINLSKKEVLEIGPGEIDHFKYWVGKPQRFVAADIQQEMLDRTSKKLTRAGITHESKLISPHNPKLLPFKQGEFDVILSFYSLEHLYPLQSHLQELLRVLREGGLLVGAIPCEGGIAWGFGRYLTSRRWLRHNTRIDPDKIICWEHPNFADHILAQLDCRMKKGYLSFWPLHVTSIDLNLVARFIYQKVG